MLVDMTWPTPKNRDLGANSAFESCKWLWKVLQAQPVDDNQSQKSTGSPIKEPWHLAWLAFSQTLVLLSNISTESNRSPSTAFRHDRQDFIYLPHSATASFDQSLDSSSNPPLPCLVFA